MPAKYLKSKAVIKPSAMPRTSKFSMAITGMATKGIFGGKQTSI
jgi:hypothetical protein